MRRVRGRLKNPDPEKESRWRQELPYPRTAPVPPRPPAPIQPVSRKPSGGSEVEECLNAGLVHTASDHKVPADSCTAHFSDTLSQTGNRNSSLWPALLHCCLPPDDNTDNKQKQVADGNSGKKIKTMTSNKLLIRLMAFKTSAEAASGTVLLLNLFPQGENLLFFI